jgi:hypothetical protein
MKQGNISLRAPEPEDLEVMLSFENDAALWELGTATGPYSRYQMKRYIAETDISLFHGVFIFPVRLSVNQVPASGGRAPAYKCSLPATCAHQQATCHKQRHYVIFDSHSNLLFRTGIRMLMKVWSGRN